MKGTLIIYLLVARVLEGGGMDYSKVTLKKVPILHSIDEAKEVVDDFVEANKQIHDSGVVSYEYQPFPIQIYPDSKIRLKQVNANNLRPGA